MPTTVPKSYNVSWLAANLGVDRRALAKVLKGIEPVKVVKRGRGESPEYFISDAVRAYFEQDEKPDFYKEKAILTRVQREKAELELKEKRGELVVLEEVQSIYVGELLNLKQRVFAVPSRLAPYLAGIESVTDIESQITDALHEQFAEFSTSDTEGGDATDA